jgi:hypothetical protein
LNGPAIVISTVAVFFRFFHISTALFINKNNLYSLEFCHAEFGHCTGMKVVEA